MNKIMKVHGKKRGALTVEAIIAFSIFVSFMFLLLSMVKVSLVKITLENAVSETAKYIANASYPIGMFNDIAEENNQAVMADVTEFKFVKDFNSKGIGALFDVMFADSDAAALTAADKGLDSMFGVLKKSGLNLVKEVVLTGAGNLISKHGSTVAGSIISEVLDNSYVDINRENLTVTVTKLPVPKHTYTTGYNTETIQELGLTKSDFNEDDVVIGVEYIYKVPLPFLTTVEVVMHEVAVEHAWVNGGAANVTKRTEGFKLDEIVNMALGKTNVYVTATGKKYHKEDCFYLWSGNYSQIKKNVAKSSGYQPCKKCCP